MTSETPSAVAEPAEIQVISLEDLKLISVPLRAHLLEALGARPRTVKELAAQFQLPATRLYYHINLLEKHGLIRVVGTRLVSGILEKHYRATARQYRVERLLFADPQSDHEAGLTALLEFVLDEAKADIRRGARSGRIDLAQTAPHPRALLIKRGVARFTPAQARRLYEKMQALLRDFTETPDEPGADIYSLAVAFYPTEYHAEEAETSETES